ncbi:hypothetical protein AXK59_15960 [Tsukamurella tyrosinosolvens]|nr:hypothetical protein AXK59_15960 [Tsukamurella tyrosinosolvens]
MRESYDIDGYAGELVGFRDGEFVKTSLGEDQNLAVSWSSDLSGPEALRKAIKAFGKPDRALEGTVVTEQSETSDLEVVDADAVEASQAIMQAKAANLVTFALDLAGVRISWVKPRAKFADSPIEHSEIGIACSLDESAAARRLMRETATSIVRRASRSGIAMKLGADEIPFTA